MRHRLNEYGFKLPWDRLQSATAARKRGWRIDGDGWWIRRLRKNDPQIADCSFGFVGVQHVYVRAAKFANAYDRGSALNPHRPYIYIADAMRRAVAENIGARAQ
jgi:hypothetical protein